MGRWLFYLIVVSVLAVWVSSYVARLVVDGYDPPPVLDAVFGAVCGSAMVVYREQQRREHRADKHRRKPGGKGGGHDRR